MDLMVQTNDARFKEKRALHLALAALSDKMTKEIEEELNYIFSDLRKSADELGFNLCVHGHYDVSKISIYKNDDSQKFSIINYEIKEIKGEKGEIDEPFNMIIKLTEEFIVSLGVHE